MGAEFAVGRFEPLLRAAMLAGRAHILTRDGFHMIGPIDGFDPSDLGYRTDGDTWVAPRGSAPVGFILPSGRIGLDWDVAYAAIRRQAQDEGAPLQHTMARLLRALVEAGTFEGEHGKELRLKQSWHVAGVRKRLAVWCPCEEYRREPTLSVIDDIASQHQEAKEPLGPSLDEEFEMLRRDVNDMTVRLAIVNRKINSLTDIVGRLIHRIAP